MRTVVLIPARNCARYLPDLVFRIIQVGGADEIIVLDDASTDDTYEVAGRLPRVYPVRNPVNLGYGGTSRRLYELAMERGADFTINIHGDLGHPPENLPFILERLQAGVHDMVIGSRLMYLRQAARIGGWRSLLRRNVRRGMPLVRVAGHFGLTNLQNLILRMRLSSYHEGMRGCTRRVIKWILKQDLPAWYSYDMALLVSAVRAGVSVEEVPVEPHYQECTVSSAPPIRYGLRVLRDSWRLRHSLSLTSECAVWPDAN